MGIFRWLLCHSLIAFILFLLTILYTLREDISANYVSLVGGYTQAPAKKLKEQASSTEPQSRMVVGNIIDKNTSDESTQSVKEKASVVRPVQSANDPWGGVLPDVTQESEPGKPVIELESESKFPPENYDPESTELDEAVVKPIASTGGGSQPRSPISNNSTGPVLENNEYFTALDEARRLYWQGQSGLAQAAYERLMFEYKELPEAAEELGNLLMQQGNLAGATNAYVNAIPRYLNLHREQEAISIISLLSQYDPVMAEKLQKKYW